MLEKDLEDIIFYTDNHELSDSGLYISGKKKRQLKLGKYGVADIVTFSRPTLIRDGLHERYGIDKRYKFTSPTVQVFELKKGKINRDSFWQVIKYAGAIKRYLENRSISSYMYYDPFRDNTHGRDIKVEIHLVGSSIDRAVHLDALPDLFEYIHLYKYKYNGNNIVFEDISFRDREQNIRSW